MMHFKAPRRVAEISGYDEETKTTLYTTRPWKDLDELRTYYREVLGRPFTFFDRSAHDVE